MLLPKSFLNCFAALPVTVVKATASLAAWESVYPRHTLDGCPEETYYAATVLLLRKPPCRRPPPQYRRRGRQSAMRQRDVPVLVVMLDVLGARSILPAL